MLQNLRLLMRAWVFWLHKPTQKSKDNIANDSHISQPICFPFPTYNHINLWKSLIQVSKNSVKNLDLEQKYAGNASDVDFIIGVHHNTYRHSLVYSSTTGMYLSVYLPSTWALSLFTNIKDSSVSFISFFFFSFSHVKLRILYCQVLCADFLNELCNEPKSVAWGISRVDFFLMIEWNL